MMINSTSTTSTIGVTLMPTIPPRPERPCMTPAIGLLRHSSELHRAGAATFVGQFSQFVSRITLRVCFGFIRRDDAVRSVQSTHVSGEQLGQGHALRLDLADAL